MAERPGVPTVATMEGEAETRSGATLTRASLQLEARVDAIEKWILENNEVLSDHAEKLDNAKLATLRLGATIQKPLEKHEADLVEMRDRFLVMRMSWTTMM